MIYLFEKKSILFFVLFFLNCEKGIYFELIESFEKIYITWNNNYYRNKSLFTFNKISYALL
ncbi:hypothetical protein HanPI659440_Chr02g0040891 [Helianthus annuus]|nr:hypothetical protein HanPI659440_Chr02g0040891 [Helianthus annuus]